MTQRNDEQHRELDPADRSPADGGDNADIPENERGQSPHIDPADKDQPAEGGREQAGGA